MEIPHDRALIGHSDADVLLHAVTDALLGAASLGDIGQLFPDTAAVNQNRDSSEMLRSAFQKEVATGFNVVNLDCILLIFLLFQLTRFLLQALVYLFFLC